MSNSTDVNSFVAFLYRFLLDFLLLKIKSAPSYNGALKVPQFTCRQDFAAAFMSRKAFGFSTTNVT